MSRVAEVIADRIQIRYKSLEVHRGGVYQIAEEVQPICTQIIHLMQAFDIPAIIGWKDGLSTTGGDSKDVTMDLINIGIERDSRLSQGGVAIVELKHGDFGIPNREILKRLVTVESDMIPKRIVAFITESSWIAGVLGNIAEDLRRV